MVCSPEDKKFDNISFESHLSQKNEQFSNILKSIFSVKFQKIVKFFHFPALEILANQRRLTDFLGSEKDKGKVCLLLVVMVILHKCKKNAF